MKNLIFGFVLIITTVGSIKAQQLPQYSQYILNRYVINPASAGIENYYQGQSNYRAQWNGIKDAPRTYILGVNGPLQQGKMGIGGYMFTDVTGPTKRNGINLSYAYHAKLSEKFTLSLALNAGILEYGVDGSEIEFENPDDFDSQNLERNVVPDAGFSFYLYTDKLFFGASAPQLLRNQIQFEESDKQLSGRLANHYFVMGGYTFQLNDQFDLQPSFLFKYVQPLDPQYEISLRGIYEKDYWAGVTYRVDDAIGLLIGFTIQDNLSIGYSYDLIQSDIRKYSAGSHELMIAVKFNQSED